MATGTITYRIDARWSLAYIRFVRFIAPLLVLILGADRTLRIGQAGAYRLMRTKVGNRPWQWGV